IRSCVIGRGVSTCSSANAIAVASGPPMKIGSVRCSPSVSRSKTIGALVGSSTRTPISSISTIHRTLPRWTPELLVATGPLLEGIRLQSIAEHRPAQALAEGGELDQVVHGLAPGSRIALLHERQYDLFEERRFAFGCHLVHPKMTGLDAVAMEPRGEPG